MSENRLEYLKLLSELYPSIAEASTEIINLSSILNLPKGTEHFVSDLHGEFEAFSHVLRNGSGSVRRKIEEVYGKMLGADEIREVCSLVYYPKDKIAYVKRQRSKEEMANWYKVMLYRLIDICRYTASKYTRAKVRKSLPADFAYVIEELITEKADIEDKEKYYEGIIDTIIRIGRAERCLIAMAHVIQRLCVDRLHILGDIFDRGNGAHRIMDLLENHYSYDIQWGNHDILWMAAATGQTAAIANVIRICARYGNMDVLEDGYGINILPLATFAEKVYGDDACELFMPRPLSPMNQEELVLTAKIHKAVSILQFKLEGALVKKFPELHMEDRAMLEKIDYEKGTVIIDGQEYPLLDTSFPTVDPANPYALTEDEQFVVGRLETAFLHSEKLQRHMLLLLNHGGLYRVFNENLLYHGCVPLTEDGNLADVEIFGETFRGKALYDALDAYVRRAYFSHDEEAAERGRTVMWWIWCSPDSPLFGKDKMATFERYFIADKETHVEVKNSYYSLQEVPEVADRILRDFGLVSENSHIINGHVPVRTKMGESPIKGGGKLIVIDGGFSKAYQKVTAIAGYTLVFNSHGMNIAAHTPFTSREEAVVNGSDIHSNIEVIETRKERITVGDTDEGARLKVKIAELEELLRAYRSGRIVERIPEN